MASPIGSSVLSFPLKLNHSNLPQQYELDRFVQDIENRHHTWTIQNHPRDWEGVACNSKGEVVMIQWEGQGLRGKLNWEHLPDTLLHLDLALTYQNGYRFNYLEGEVNFHALPPKLRSFIIGDNRFSGTPDLSALPENLEWLDICSNNFSGSIDLSHLPQNLQQLHLHFNPDLLGELREDEMPQTLRSIQIEGTQIIRYTHLNHRDSGELLREKLEKVCLK